jgi:prepilin-type N-terminal cleavage/methylation domain-containing protein
MISKKSESKKGNNKIDWLNKNKGFTLVEMLFAIGILVVLSGAILVSLSTQRDKANANRMFSEVSAVIPAVYMCIADGGTVNAPSGSGGGPICDLSSNYGSWPVSSNIEGIGNYNPGGDFDNNTWYFSLSSTSSVICCNAKMASCKILSAGSGCDNDTN